MQAKNNNMYSLYTVLSLSVTLIALILIYIIFKFKKIHAYWADRNVPHVPPTYLGLLSKMPPDGITGLFKKLYHDNKHHTFFGIWSLHRPALMVNDPELIKHFLVQDFSHFHDHTGYFNEKDDPLIGHLFSLDGTKWRNLRVRLTPTFTSGKMKTMFATVEKITFTLMKVCDRISESDGIFDSKEIMACFTADVIASIAFGIKSNCLENPEAEFRTAGQKIFDPDFKTMIKNATAFFMPDLARKLKLVLTPAEISEFFLRIFKESINYRKEYNEKRGDFLQLLIQMMDKGTLDDVDHNNQTDNTTPQKFTFNEAAAQAFIFYFAGFETASSALQFTLFELAKNQDIQDRLREEINRQLEEDGGKMTYEGIHQMKYMGCILDEIVRLYPPAVFLNRECTIPYKIPDTDLTIEKGTTIYISVIGLHSDKRYFPNPEVFDPERFTEEQKAIRPRFTYLPFGDGPRVCIGQRFALMEMRIALTALIKNYRFECCDETPKTVELDPNAVVFVHIKALKLKIVKL